MPFYGSPRLEEAAAGLLRGLARLCIEQEDRNKGQRSPYLGIAPLQGSRIVFIGDYPLSKYLGKYEKEMSLTLVTNWDGPIRALQNKLVEMNKPLFELEEREFRISLPDANKKVVVNIVHHNQALLPDFGKTDIPAGAIHIDEIKFEDSERVHHVKLGKWPLYKHVVRTTRIENMPIVKLSCLFALALYEASRQKSDKHLREANKILKHLPGDVPWEDWERRTICDSLQRIVRRDKWDACEAIRGVLARKGFPDMVTEVSAEASTAASTKLEWAKWAKLTVGGAALLILGIIVGFVIHKTYCTPKPTLVSQWIIIR